MKTATPFPKTGRADEWTRERLDRLDKQQVLNLQENAKRLDEPALVALCAEVLQARRKRT